MDDFFSNEDQMSTFNSALATLFRIDKIKQGIDTATIRDQVHNLLLRKNKRKVIGKTIRVSLNLFFESFRFHAVDSSQIGIQNDTMSTHL